MCVEHPQSTLLLLGPVLVAGAVLVGAWVWLNAYTRHNARVEVPDLANMTPTEALPCLKSWT
jgi:hypothetical protein